MKNSADLGGRYSPRPSASVDNTLLDLQNSSYPTQPHPKIDLFTDTAAILDSIVSDIYYGMLSGQIHTNLPPQHPIITI